MVSFDPIKELSVKIGLMLYECESERKIYFAFNQRIFCGVAQFFNVKNNAMIQILRHDRLERQ